MLPYGKQSIDDADIAAVTETLRGDFLTTGPAVEKFEASLAAACGAPHAVACSSGTAALHMGAVVSGLGPGNTAIVPAITFLATATTAILAGADVVLADVDPDNGLMRPQDLETAMDRARKSGGTVQTIFPVHVGGQTVDMEAVADIARRHGCRIVEDACHALDTTYEGHRVGDCAHSDMAAFSFHPVKTIAMGEGGAVTTRDPALAEKLRRLRNHGMVRDADAFEIAEQAFDAAGNANPWYYEMQDIGLNYRASDIHCALGHSQLQKLGKFAARRRALAAYYDTCLAETNMPVRRISLMPGVDACWHLYTVLIDFDRAGLTRSEVMKSLAARGIGTQVHYIPLHLQPFYRRRLGEQSLPGAEEYYARCLSLPLFAGMENSDADNVLAALNDVLCG